MKVYFLCEFIEFEFDVCVNFYDIVYCCVGGMMCVYNFVNVLEFFFYYVFIDKIWVDW